MMAWDSSPLPEKRFVEGRMNQVGGEEGTSPSGRSPRGVCPTHGAVHSLTDKEFRLFQSLIHREAGIYLSPVKKALLAGRLGRRLRELGLSTFNAYYQLVTGGDGEERVRMLDCICTNETEFFREPRQFEFLENHVFAEWKAREAEDLTGRHIRIWSAACSTGEEPYSLAMAVLHHFPPRSGWKVEILATDLSTRALEAAQAGIWPAERAKNIPSAYLRSFMLEGIRSQAGKIKAGPEIRSLVRFQRVNLNDQAYPMVGRFHLIFCRNVMIYFDAESKARVVHRLLDHLSPNGYLFLGHAESLNGVIDEVRNVIPTVYALSGGRTSRPRLHRQEARPVREDESANKIAP